MQVLNKSGMNVSIKIMKNRIKVILLLILSSISISAQNISYKELKGSAWEYIVPKGTVMGGPIIV